MFAKLLKYEWRATAPTMGILSLAALGVSLLAGIVLRLITGDLFSGDGASMAVESSLVILLVFLVLALVGYSAACQILLIVRFYKHKFTDQGYLTFTLPVTSRELFFSSMTNMILWTILSSLVLVVAATILILVGVPAQAMEEAAVEWDISLSDMGLSPITMVLQMVVGLLYSPTLIMTCLTVGAVVAKKHKVLMAFAAYYIVSMIVSILSSALMLVPMMADSLYHLLFQPDLLYLGQMLIQAILCVVGYFLTTRLMDRKLNLP